MTPYSGSARKYLAGCANAVADSVGPRCVLTTEAGEFKIGEEGRDMVPTIYKTVQDKSSTCAVRAEGGVVLCVG
jgi:hypothetical protein